MELASPELNTESTSQSTLEAMPAIAAPDADAIASPGSRLLASFAQPEDDPSREQGRGPCPGRQDIFKPLSLGPELLPVKISKALLALV